MIEVRVAETDADLEAWRAVRLEVVPYERAPSVADLQRAKAEGELQVLAWSTAPSLARVSRVARPWPA